MSKRSSVEKTWNKELRALWKEAWETIAADELSTFASGHTLRFSSSFTTLHTSRHADQRPRHDLTPPPHILHHSLTKTATRELAKRFSGEQKKPRKETNTSIPGADVGYQSPLSGDSIRERRRFL